MVLCCILACAGLITLVFYVREKSRKYSLLSLFLKTGVSVLFLATGLCAWHSSPAYGKSDIMAPFVLMGLICGLLGDVFLDLKFIYPKDDRPYTYAGFLAFAAGHLLFNTGLLLQFRPEKPILLLIPCALCLLFGCATLVMEKPLKLVYGNMKPIVFIYGCILFSIVAVSGYLSFQTGWRQPALTVFFIGSILFVLSDLVLSGTYFGKGKERPIDFILNYAFYYGAQYLIAFSLLFLQ